MKTIDEIFNKHCPYIKDKQTQQKIKQAMLDYALCAMLDSEVRQEIDQIIESTKT